MHTMLERRFLIAPSFARLIKERSPSERVLEGYFSAESRRQHFLRIEPDRCHLVLAERGENNMSSLDRCEVSRSHADALMQTCRSRIAFERTRVSLGAGREVLIKSLTTPGSLDLVTVEFVEEQLAHAFSPPAWFGREVTAEDGFEMFSIGLNGLPPAEECAISDTSLGALLDVLSHGIGDERRGDANVQPPAAAERIQVTPRLLRGREHENKPVSSWKPAGAGQQLHLDGADQRAGAVAGETSVIDGVLAGLAQALSRPHQPAV